MKLFFASLGCDKNLVDSEVMLGLLNRHGCVLTDDESQADVIIVNTCCFIGDAKEESIETILELSRQKQEGSCRALIVTGCLAERYREEVLAELPEVDAVVGTASYDKICEVLDEVMGDITRQIRCLEDQNRLPQTSGPRLLTTGGHYAFLKIAEGCDKHCTYCIIPKVRGRYRSVPMERLLQEARELVSGGVRELILVAQETTLYGVDLYGRKMLPELLLRLAQIPELVWIRIQYCYPEEITEELIRVMAQEPKICRYLDIPIQHASDPVLKRMGRRTRKAELVSIIERLRAELPDIALRTTLIAGFPGETPEDHEENLAFVDEIEFERLGVFAYSREEDTPAAEMPDQIDESVKEQRRDELMELQQDIAYEKAQSMIGRHLTVMIEGYLSADHTYVGRTYMDAPDVDGYIFVQSDAELVSGDFVPVVVTGAVEYDLIGEIDDEFAE